MTGRAATGGGDVALLDGGKWDHLDCMSPLLEVVASGGAFGDNPGGLNTLVVDGSSDGSCWCAHGQDLWDPGYQG